MYSLLDAIKFKEECYKALGAQQQSVHSLVVFFHLVRYNTAMAKKALLILLALIISLASFSGTVFAQDSGGDEFLDLGNGQAYVPDQKLIEEYTTATKNCAEPSLECLVYYTTNYVAIQLIQGIMPIDDIGQTPPPTDPQGNSFTQGVTVARSRGVLPGIAYFMGQMYANPAASTPVYIADVLNSANIATPAYAQGLGFGALNPILELWKLFRNIAYMFYVVIFIAIGFLIMFRKKVGQSAITAQQAIPSTIVSLLFVTFSYAIAGLLIDLMYLTMFLIVGLFQSTFSSNPDIINFSILELSATFIKDGAIAGFNAGSSAVKDMIEVAFNLQRDSLVSDAFGWVSGITVGLVIAIAILIGSFKLFFELLKSYATVVLLVVVGPIQLMMGAIPGRDAFTPWFKNILANLFAFPTVLMAAVMFYVFTDGTVNANGGFLPPFLVGRGAADAIATLMGLAILLAMPDIVKEVKKKMGATEGFGDLIANRAYANTKPAIPLGTRLGLAPGAAAAGAIGGATLGGLRGTGRGIRQGAKMFARNPSLGAVTAGISTTIGSTFRGGAGSMVGGARRGLGTTSQAANWLTKSVGANQPDVFNPLTKGYDRLAVADEDARKRLEEQEKERSHIEHLAEYIRKT